MTLELFGYLGSLLVVVSLMMPSLVKLRIYNTIGSAISATYALIIHSYPLVLMNVCIIVINAYNLIKLLGSDKHYDLIDSSTDETYLNYFLDYYKQDMGEFFPEMSMKYSDLDRAYLVCSDAAPVGLLMGRLDEEGTLEVAVDYAVPTYRDCSIGKFLYPQLANKGVRKLVCREYGDKHEPYMKKMGFVKRNGVYERPLVGA